MHISFMYVVLFWWLEQFSIFSRFFFLSEGWLIIFFFFKAAQHKAFIGLLFTCTVACHGIRQGAGCLFLWCVLCLIDEVWPWRELWDVVKLQKAAFLRFRRYRLGRVGQILFIILVLNRYPQHLCLIFYRSVASLDLKNLIHT